MNYSGNHTSIFMAKTASQRCKESIWPSTMYVSQAVYCNSGDNFVWQDGIFPCTAPH